MTEHRNVIDRIEHQWEHGHRESRKDADSPWTRDFRSEYVRSLRRFWFQKTPVQIMSEDMGFETTAERANEFASASDNNPDMWYYLANASHSTDEALKWIMSAGAAEINARGMHFTDMPKLLPAHYLRLFATAINHERIDRTFTKAIFAKLLELPSLVDSEMSLRVMEDHFEALIALPEFKAISADDLEPIIDQIIAANPDQFEKAKTNPKLVQFFVGQTMKATQGKAPPPKVIEIMQRKLTV